jgi:hypothetical protein
VLLIVLAIACVLSVPLRGGRLRRLGEIELRAQWAALVALALQIVVLGVFTGGAAWWHAVAHIATYGLAAWFVWANRAIPGVVLMAAGGALNLLAIAANHGVMPTSAWAERAAGLQPTDAFANSAVLAHPHLLWLGDVIPVPLPIGLSNVLSVGDLLIYAGALVLLHRTCVRPTRPSSGLESAESCQTPIPWRSRSSTPIAPSTASPLRSGSSPRSRS